MPLTAGTRGGAVGRRVVQRGATPGAARASKIKSTFLRSFID